MVIDDYKITNKMDINLGDIVILKNKSNKEILKKKGDVQSTIVGLVIDIGGP